jgi:heptosyltransferase-2
MAPAAYNRILVRLPNWVGDAVMATPALRCVRLNFPKAKIDVTLLPYVKQIVEGAPWFDNIIECPPRRRPGGISATLDYVRELRRNHYDLAVVLPNSFNSALLAFLSGAKRRVGYNRQGRGFLLTSAIPAPTKDGKFVPQPMVGYYLRLCMAIGAIPESEKTELFVDSASEYRAEKLFEKCGVGQGKTIIAIAPGAAYGSSKLWVSRSFAEVADGLVDQRNCEVVLVGGRRSFKAGEPCRRKYVVSPA